MLTWAKYTKMVDSYFSKYGDGTPKKGEQYRKLKRITRTRWRLIARESGEIERISKL